MNMITMTKSGCMELPPLPLAMEQIEVVCDKPVVAQYLVSQKDSHIANKQKIDGGGLCLIAVEYVSQVIVISNRISKSRNVLAKG